MMHQNVKPSLLDDTEYRSSDNKHEHTRLLKIVIHLRLYALTKCDYNAKSFKRMYTTPFSCAVRQQRRY